VLRYRCALAGCMETGLVFNLQRYSVQDGPGIRTTVFLKGCPLHCAWCHNPEGQSARPELLVLESRCLACGECRRACPSGATLAGNGALPARHDFCTLCGACVAACPSGARQQVGRAMSVDEVMAEVLTDRVFYDESGGGVTFSGGEPLAQPRFLQALLQASRDQRLHTAVDTSGFASTECLLAIAGLADLFLYDLKLMDDAKHRQYCGGPVGPVLANLQALARVHANLWIRIPIIPGVNDGPGELEALAEFVATFDPTPPVSLLPYHATGTGKFRRLGLDYALDAVDPPSPAAMDSIREQFRARGVTAHVGANVPI